MCEEDLKNLFFLSYPAYLLVLVVVTEISCGRERSSRNAARYGFLRFFDFFHPVGLFHHFGSLSPLLFSLWVVAPFFVNFFLLVL
jgi:hypothetical protein